jgi:hypothetical protein
LAGTAPRSNRKTNLNATTASSHDEAGFQFFDGQRRREAARHYCFLLFSNIGGAPHSHLPVCQS